MGTALTMMNAEVFKRFKEYLPPQALHQPFHLDNPIAMDQLFYYFRHSLDTVKPDISQVIKISELFYFDLQDLEKNIKGINEVIQFLKFHSCAYTLMIIKGLAMFGYMRTWLINAIKGGPSDQLVHLRNFLISKEPLLIKNRSASIWSWVSSLFYYSNITGDLLELANDVMNDFSKDLKPTFKYTNLFAIDALQNIFIWCIIHKRTKDIPVIAKMLEDVYEKNEVDVDFRISVGYYLSGRGATKAGIDGKSWARRILTDHQHKLEPVSKMNLILHECVENVELLEKRMDELLKTIKDYCKSVQWDRNAPAMKYREARNFEVVFNALSDCMLDKRTDLAEEIFFAYYDLPSLQELKGKILHIIPNSEDGVNYCMNNQVVNWAIDPTIKTPELTAAESSFLNLPIPLNDTFDYTPVEVPKHRIGIPIAEKSLPYQKQLSSYFNFPLIQSLDTSAIIGYHDHYNYRRALQPMMISELGFTFPILQSFKNPLPPRQIKNVLVWRGLSNMPDVECDGIKLIMEKKGVNVTILDGYVCSVQDFIDHYNSPLFDVIFVCGHGQYKPGEPHESYIQLHENKELNIADLSKLRLDINERRLLFLNICDGASSVLKNGPQGISISQNLVNDNQSVMSHVWPVSPRCAMIMNWILAGLLLDGNDYLSIYTQMVLLIKDGKAGMLEFLSRYTSESDMLDRITYSDENYSLFYYWGSLTYAI